MSLHLYTTGSVGVLSLRRGFVSGFARVVLDLSLLSDAFPQFRILLSFIVQERR